MNGATHVVANALADRALRWLKGALGLEAGQDPFPWQGELLRRFCDGESTSALDIPTGLGKTATMAVWLVARALGAGLPRRLVYLVDRRAVVDQATDVAEKLRAWVRAERPVSDALGLGERPLPISTLRGQHVDNREWLADPSLPAILVGTIDMVGSRLLFSGYGVSSKMRPYHAGLLGADTLIVLDEAHLVPVFEDLLRQVEGEIETFGPEPAFRDLVPKFSLLSLSATGRETGSSPLTLSEADHKVPAVVERLYAKKTLTTIFPDVLTGARVAGRVSVGHDEGGGGEAKRGKAPKLADELANQVWELTKQGRDRVRCLVFCDARKDAIAVAGELRNLAKMGNTADPIIELLVGGRRVLERTHAQEALAQLGFLAGTSKGLERAAFLIATSAGEVGVDLDADHMVCDLVAWERMVQRLGRVNRRGGKDSEGRARVARIIVVGENEPAPSDGTTKALQKRDASKLAIGELGDLTKKLRELRAQKQMVAKGKKRTNEERAADEERKKKERDLAKAIAACKTRSKLFKDVDARLAARYDAELTKRRALRQLLETVGEGGDLSPDSLARLRKRRELAETLRKATTVEPLRPELTRAVVDAWSMTSLDEHSGRPQVDLWLRGFRVTEPQTTVVWRRHLPVRSDCAFDAKAASRFFEAAPPHASEQLETETRLVLDWLIERAVDVSEAHNSAPLPTGKQIVAIALTPSGDVRGWWTLKQLTAARAKGTKAESKEAKRAREQTVQQLEEFLNGATVVVDARFGGLTDGLLREKTNTPAHAADDLDTPWLNCPETIDVPVTGFRVRELRRGQLDSAGVPWNAPPDNGWVRRLLFVTAAEDGEPSEALVIDGWVNDAATEDERAEADRPQKLDEHQIWAEECARGIATRLGLAKQYEDLLALAARLHDEGKRAARWQRAFKAPVDGRPYAKTRGPIDFDILDGYRHELGSLPYVEKHREFIKLAEEQRELVLHLIAAHHGYARPVIGARGCEDPPSVVEERAREVALRFARLSKRWGPWGLAWWEALVRAADQIASRRNQQASSSLTAEGEQR